MIVSTGNTCERRTGEDERSTKTPSFNYVSHKGIVTGHSKDRTHLICPHVLDSDRWAIHSRLSRNQADNEIPFFFVLLLLMHSSLSVSPAVGRVRALRPGVRSHTEEELGMPCRVVPLGVPLMALKICSESERALLVPPSAVEI